MINCYTTTNIVVEEIREAMQRVLQPVMNDLTSLRGDITNLSETMSHQQETMKSLSEDLEEHKNQTTSELADLQSSIDNPSTGAISGAVLLTLLPYLNNIEENLMTDLSSLINDRATSTDESVSSLSGGLEMNKNWTMSELAHLQTSLQSISDRVTTIDESVSSFREENWTKSELADLQTSLNSTLVSLNVSVTEELRSMKRQLIDTRVDLTDAHNMSEEFENQVRTLIDPLCIKVVELDHNLQRNMTVLNGLVSDRATSIDDSVRSLSGEFGGHKNHTVSALADLQASLSSELASLNSSLTEKLRSMEDQLDAKIDEMVLSYARLSEECENEENTMLDPLCAKLVENLHQNMTELSSLISDRATSVNVSVSSLRGDLQEYKNWTMSELADLQASLNSELASLNNNVTEEFNSVEDQLNAKLDELGWNMTHMNSLISGRINDSVSSLRGDLEEHKNQTTSELTDLQVSLNSKLASLNNNVIEEFRSVEDQLDTKIDKLAQNMTDTSSLISGRIDKSVSSLRGDLDLVEHKNQTISRLADLQDFMDTLDSKLVSLHSNMTENLKSTEGQLDAKLNELDSELVLLYDHMGEEFQSLGEQLNATINPLNSKLASVDATSTLMRDDLSCVKTDLSSLNDSMNRVCDKVEEHEDHMTAEMMQLNKHIKQNFTHQISHINTLGVHTCGGTGGWRRVVYLDMTDNNTDCPSGWRETGYFKRTCGRASVVSRTCDSVTFPVSGGKYNQVCGRIKAYQWGETRGFYGYSNGYNTIDDAYFSGVAVMHGHPREHIWTFAAGSRENYNYVSTISKRMCPCDTRDNIPIPQFVGEDYFCESGYTYPGPVYTFHSNDTLWDGRDCHSSSTCCTQRNPPYFTKNLSVPNTDDIELRMCGYSSTSTDNIAVELIELYVKEQDHHTDTQLMRLTQLSGKIDLLDSKLGLLNINVIHEIISLESQVNTMINPLNSKLASVDATCTLMRDDLNCVKTDLSSLNNSVNRVCDKVEEHEDHMTAELMELNEYLKENLTHQISSNDNYICGGTGGWRRAVYLDMTDPNTDCPSGWRETGYSKRTCGRVSSRLGTCDSVIFPVSGGEYSQVCGRIKAYQWGLPFGFNYRYSTIDETYFSGVAVMHGSPRQHIWTFVAGRWENNTSFMCPCDTKRDLSIPPYVGQDYFCESGYVYPGYEDRESSFALHSNDTLWDGRDCHSSSTCCSHHNPPYFTKTLNIPTTDDLELRMCNTDNGAFENLAIELIELYVKENYMNTKLMELDHHLKRSFTHQINTINSLGVHTCGGTGGWRRAVYLDMTDPNTDCPSGWRETGYSKRTCGRASNGFRTCGSVAFSVSGGEYSQVCGRIKAYQWGSHWGFYGYRAGHNTTDDVYFSGVAVMHGSPRQHIWTFVAGSSENDTSTFACPCDSRYYIPIPPFVGEDYFCESGYIYPGYWEPTSQSTFYSNDTLWDGRDCHSSSTCCSFHNPPYFTKTLSTPTTDNIELRMCNYYGEKVAVELIELYVK